MQFNRENFQRNVLTDVECIVEKQVFKCHRHLLVDFSPFLKKHLVDDKGNPLSKKIRIPDIRSSEFEILLQYMYSGNLEIHCNNFIDVHEAASVLKMKGVRDECYKKIKGADEIRTYFFVYVFTKKKGDQRSLDKALQLITHRFEETVFAEEFMYLDISYATEILKSDKIGARSETIVFLAALNWLNHDFGRRNIHIKEIMECVRFSCMSVEEILACYHPPFIPEVVLNADVLLMLYQATCYIAAKSQGQEASFGKYARPERYLVFKSLKMKLWNIQPSAASPTTTKGRNILWEDEREQFKTVSTKLDSAGTTELERRDEFVSSSRPDKRHAMQQEDSKQKGSLADVLRDEPFADNLDEDEKPFYEYRDFSSEASVRSPHSSKKDESIPGLHRNQQHGPRTVPSTSNKWISIESLSLKGVTGEIKEIKGVRMGPSFTSGGRAENEDARNTERMPVQEENDQGRRSPTDHNNTVHGCILIIGGIDPKNYNKDAGASVRTLKVIENEWIQYINMPVSRQNHSSVCFKNCLYVIGGCDPRETVKTNRYIAERSCFRLDLRNSQWSKLPDMKYARFDHAAVLFHEQLFVIGGQDENGKLLKSIEMYEPQNNRWTLQNSKMCCGRKAMGVAVYDNLIWIAGGFIKSKSGQFEAIPHIDCYDPHKKKWYFELHELPGPRCFCSLIEWDSKLYCIGGMVPVKDEETGSNGLTGPTKEVWCFKRETEKWEECPSLPEPRIGGVAVVYGDELYYLGGFDPENSSSSQDVFLMSPGDTSWTTGPRMTSPLFGFSAVSLKVIKKK